MRDYERETGGHHNNKHITLGNGDRAVMRRQ